jgi:hypothetical protein
VTVIPARVLLAILVLLGVFVGVIEAAAFSQDEYASGHAMQLWQFVYFIVVASWVEVDSRVQPRIYKPSRFGWLVLLYLPLYLPYYLIRSRGAIGVVWLLGFVALLYLGPLLMLGMWAAS